MNVLFVSITFNPWQNRVLIGSDLYISKSAVSYNLFKQMKLYNAIILLLNNPFSKQTSRTLKQNDLIIILRNSLSDFLSQIAFTPHRLASFS